MKLALPKGTRDFAPAEKIVRQKVVETLKGIFELYGYSPLETPIIERFDVLSSKYAGGAEILKETFNFKDNADRELGLRYDLTVPLCRFVGMDPTLKMPFKRYEIGQVYRNGPIKLGRYREFWQCDVDIVGCKNVIADAEMIKIADDVFRKLGFEVVIEFNDRKILEGVLDYAGITQKEKRDATMVAIDKRKKIGVAEVKKEMAASIDEEQADKVLDAIGIEGKDKISQLAKIITSDTGKEGIEEIKKILDYLDSMNVESASFEPSLARGLAYYTGPVFEVYLKDSEIKSAAAGGGRYDKMIGEFLGSQKEYPATGISFGLEVITEALKLAKKTEEKCVTKVYVIPIGTQKESLKILQKLRDAGINADIDMVGRGPSKNLNYADSMGIPYVIIIGDDEIRQKKVKLKDMKRGGEVLVKIDDVIVKLK